MASTLVLVTGPGRSGTSLAMQALAGLGLTTSDNLKSGDRSNPLGFFEDRDVNAVLNEFFDSLGISARVPRPADWRQAAAYAPTRETLRRAVLAGVAGREGVFGIKAPLSSLFLPLWHDVLSEIGIVPRVVFCARDAGAVVQSLMQTYDRDSGTSQGRYFYRCLHFLQDTAAETYFLHYEDWGTEPRETLASLAQYCGLASPGEDLTEKLFQPSLDRASKPEPVDLLGPVARMNEALRLVRGRQGPDNVAAAFARALPAADFDRRSPFCRALALEAKAWKLARELAVAKAQARTAEPARETLTALRAREDRRLVAARAQIAVHKLQHEQDRVAQSAGRSRIAALTRENAKLRRAAESLEASLQHRAGGILMEAGRKPFTKGPRLPFSLIAFYFRDVRARRAAARVKAAQSGQP